MERLLGALEVEDEAQLVPEAAQQRRGGVARPPQRRPRQVAARQHHAQRAPHDQHQEQPQERLDRQLRALTVVFLLTTCKYSPHCSLTYLLVYIY